MSDKIVHLTDEAYEDVVINAKGAVLVDFWAPWCGPCKSLGPHLEAIAEQFDNVKVCKVNIDENNAWASRLGVMSIPTLILYVNGEIVAKQIGYLDKAQLEDFINNHI